MERKGGGGDHFKTIKKVYRDVTPVNGFFTDFQRVYECL